MAEEESARQQEDDGLVQKAVGGDKHALVSLLYAHYDRLIAHIRRNLPADVRSVLDAEDLVQQTHIKAFRNIHTFKAQGARSFYPWLVRIADNTRIDELRKLQRRRFGQGQEPPANRVPSNAATDSALKLLDLLAVNEHTPSHSAARRDAARAVRSALVTLNPRQREAVTLVYLDQLSLEEAARKMGTTKQAVYSLVYRGLARLREVMGSMSNYLSRK